MTWALLFGNFVVGSGVMGVAATLHDMAGSLAVAPAQLGVLISAASLTICLSAPLLAALVGRFDRRRLLVGCMLWFALTQLLIASAPDLDALLPLRIASVLAPALFSPQAAACAGWLANREHRGRAVTTVFLGWSAASVIGMPLYAWSSSQIGWRLTFIGLALLSLLSAYWLQRWVPRGIRPPPLDLRAWAALTRNPVVLLCIAVTALFSGGQFMLLAYFSPYFVHEVGLNIERLSLLFAWFGVLGFAGNAIATGHIDRLGAARVLTLSLLCIAASLALWPLVHVPGLLWLVVAPWGLAIFIANTAQQTRLVTLAPAAATATVALNASAMYGGQALGAAGGAHLFLSRHADQVHVYALIAVLAALALSWLAMHLQRRRYGIRAAAAPTAPMPLSAGGHSPQP